MTVTAPDYTARIVGTPDIPVSLRTDSGRLSLDSARAPHVEGTVTLSVDDPTMLVDLDPRSNRRLKVEAGGRVFNLGIREVNPDRAAGTVNVQLASDEALLDDYAQLVNDPSPRAVESSLRSVCNYALSKIGAALQPGGPDANVTAYWTLSNLLMNPSLEVDAANWVSVGASSALTRVASGNAPAGAYSLRWTVGGAASHVAPLAALTDLPAVPGRRYVFAAYVAATAGNLLRARVQWRNANGTVVVSTIAGVSTVATASTYHRVSIIATAPPGTTHCVPYVSVEGGTSGQFAYVDCAMFYEGNEVVGYFDGSTVIAGYVCTWQDVAHKSPSTRTPIIERRPEALVWQAGTSALAFLHPLVQAAGLRLVCNERREWTLRTAEYRAPGVLSYRFGVNIAAADEQLSRSSEEWFDGAVFRYIWTDADGVEQERIDAWATSPTPSKIILREVSAPYPGPGRAQYAVTRAQGRGRTVVIKPGLPTWQEAAEQPLSIVLDSTAVQTGISNRIEYDIAANEVTITSRTTDIPAGAIDLLPGTINALPGTINSL